jgi:hypothetical protein
MRALLIAAALLLGGCGSTEATTLQHEVHFLRGGGIAGMQDELVIHPDGRATLTSRGEPTRRFQVSKADRDAIARALQEARFSTLPKDVSPGPPWPDNFGYGVVYRGHHVSGEAGRIPDRLQPVLDRLGDVARAHGLR